MPEADASSVVPGYLPELGAVPGLIWAFRVHHDGSADPLPCNRPIEHPQEGWIWLHLDLADPLATQWLKTSGLPPAAVATLLSRDRHQQLHATPTFIHGIIADLERAADGSSAGVGHLRFVMTDRLLVSGRHRDLVSVATVRAAIESGEHVADVIDEMTDDLATELDGIENALADGSIAEQRQRLARVRHSAVRLHRQLAGLRAVFHRLERKGAEGITPTVRRRQTGAAA